MSDDLSLHVTEFLQHKTDFAAKWTVTSRLHGFTPGRAGSGYLTGTAETALHQPGEEGRTTSLLLPRRAWEVRGGRKPSRGPRELGLADHPCWVSIRMLPGGNTFPRTPTGPVRSSSSSQAGLKPWASRRAERSAEVVDFLTLHLGLGVKLEEREVGQTLLCFCRGRVSASAEVGSKHLR